jgi:hypothetical protein
MGLLFFGIFDETVKKLSFDKIKIKKNGIHKLEEYGLPDSWQGGHAHRVVEVEGSKIMIIIDKQNRTISAMIDSKQIHCLKKEALNELKVKYLHHKVLDVEALERDEVLTMLRAEGINEIRLFKSQTTPSLSKNGEVVESERSL